VGVASAAAPTARAQTAQPLVVHVPIQNTIDLGLAPYLQRVVNDAAQRNAAAVVLEINTPGGRLDAVLQMRDTVLQSPVHTIAFVNTQAFSAGALVAIAADEIYMAPGAVMGAATPVDGTGTPADAKTISAVRSTFRATAEERNRDPLVAEAMVDPDVAIPGLVEQGQLLTLTTQQAQTVGYADGVGATLDAVLVAAGLGDAALETTAPSLAERVVRFLTHPVVASLLTSLGVVLILADVYTAGFGLLGGAGIALLALFFWGHMLAGLAGWEGIALVLLGVVLVGLEVLVIPGFGVAGIAGGAALLGGVWVSLIGGDGVTDADMLRATYTVLGALVLMIIGGIGVVRFLPRSRRFGALVLQAQVGRQNSGPAPTHERTRGAWITGARLEPDRAHDLPHANDDVPSLIGMTGVALGGLRPSGFADISGQRVDVVTGGDYIRAGERIEVIADEGYRRVVRRAPHDRAAVTGETQLIEE
jgi:membrane-bound serine protease (ClpP class)